MPAVPGCRLAAGWAWEEAARCCPPPPGVPSRIPGVPSLSQPKELPFPAWGPCLFTHPPYLSQCFLLSLPFLHCRPTTVACNNFIYFFLIPFLYLSPQSSRCHCGQFPRVTASFKHHILLQDTNTSDSACPLSPLCRLYIASYLNSRLFSWLNKPRTSYSKGIRVLLESYIAILLF